LWAVFSSWRGFEEVEAWDKMRKKGQKNLNPQLYVFLIHVSLSIGIKNPHNENHKLVTEV